MPRRFLSALTLLLVLSACDAPSFLGEGGADSSSSSVPSFKMYVSEKYGIEMRYPADWKVSDDSKNFRIFNRSILFQLPDGSVEEGVVVDMMPKRADTPESLAYKFDKSVLLRVSDMTVGGEPAKRVELRTAGQTIILVRHAGFMYRFVTQGPLLDEGVIDSVRFTREEEKK